MSHAKDRFSGSKQFNSIVEKDILAEERTTHNCLMQKKNMIYQTFNRGKEAVACSFETRKTDRNSGLHLQRQLS